VLSRLKIPALLLLAAAFAPVAHAAPDGGLLITRATSETWQIRLIAGTQMKQFDGVFDSSVAFSSVTPVQLESSDSARLSTPNQLSLKLNVWPSRTDGTNFRVSSGTKLCLRDTGSSNVKVYMGTTLADAVLLTAPASLLGTDACGTTTVDNPPPLPASPRKFNPGHYVVMMRKFQSQDAMYTASNHPGVRGVVKRYTWRSLEPSLGNYNFSEVQADLAWAQSYGKQLVVYIEDKTFVDEMVGPDYLAKYSLRNRKNGFTMQRWDPYVVARMNALTKAFGARFDSNSALEGVIVGEESAPGLDGTVLDAASYTPEKYRDALISMLTAASDNLPTSRVFFNQNFFPRKPAYLAAVAAAVAPRGVVLGGPDNAPDHKALVTLSYPLYDQMQGKMPMFIQVEPLCYWHLHETSGYATKYWTMPELFANARDKLHSNYIFWVNYPRRLYPESYTYQDALKVIAANPTFTP
jgi:hypothetical protein